MHDINLMHPAEQDHTALAIIQSNEETEYHAIINKPYENTIIP